jgi:hypothetical protein
MFNTGLCKPLPGLTSLGATAAGATVGAGVAAVNQITCGVTTGASQSQVLTPEQPVYLDADFGIQCVNEPTDLDPDEQPGSGRKLFAPFLPVNP